MTEPTWLQRMALATREALMVFCRDVGHGLLEVSHNMLALLGLLVVAALVLTLGRADLREGLERQTLSWLQSRVEARDEETGLLTLPEDLDVAQQARALAADPATLNRQQSAVVNWLSRRYRVAPEPLARLVQESWEVGQRAKLDPSLILAIVAVESSFNPFAQSAVGAQGLMQVMTRIHNEKYEAFGGKLAAFDPVTNLKVGVQVLKECIARAGSLELGLRHYVGAANLEDDGGYAGRVLLEQSHIARVAAGQQVPVTAPTSVATNQSVSPPAEAAVPRQASEPAAGPAPVQRVALAG